MNSIKVILNKTKNNFYEVYNDDAYVLASIMKYKLVLENDNLIKTGFPNSLLSDVIHFLKKNSVSFEVDDDIELSCDFGSENRYNKFLKKNIPVEKIYAPHIKKYSGSFEVIFEDDDIEEWYIIDKDINGNAELVIKTYQNNIGDEVSLDSGIKFKIVGKNIEYK